MQPARHRPARLRLPARVLTLLTPPLGAAADKTSLKMLFWTFQPQTVQGFADEFMKRNPNITVELDAAPSAEYNAKASVMLRSGAPVDVMYILGLQRFPSGRKTVGHPSTPARAWTP